MRTRKNMVVAVLVVAMGGLMAVGQAWSAPEGGGAGGPGLFPGRPLLACLREAISKLRSLKGQLGLSMEQKKEIGAILIRHRGDIADVIRDVHAKRKAVMQAVRAEQVDEAAIRAATRDLSQALGDGAVLRAKVRKEVRAVLNSGQKHLVDEVLAEIEASFDKAVSELPK